MKQSKQPRPGPGRVDRTMRPDLDTRPAKPPAAEGPDSARSAPRTTAGDRLVKGERLEPREGVPSKAAFEVRAQEAQDAYPDQRPRDGAPEAARGADEGAQQYVRLRIRARGDHLSVIDSHLVDGPLSQVTAFTGTNAYEVTLDERLLHAGALPDLGVQRSFPNPAGPQLQQGHFVTERDTFEFMARVPAEELTPETTGRIRLTLHRLSAEVRAERLGPEPLARQFEREVHPVAELEGLPDSVLPTEITARGGRTPRV